MNSDYNSRKGSIGLYIFKASDRTDRTLTDGTATEPTEPTDSTADSRADAALYSYRFSPSGYNFGETGGAFFALYGIAPRASAVYGRSLGGVFLRYMVSARRLEMS